MNGHFPIGAFLKNRMTLAVGLAALLLTASLIVALKRSQQSVQAAADARTNHDLGLIAGPGRIEPYSEDIKIGSELSGRLKSVKVEEGDTIRRGQVVTELENADYRAQLESSRVNVLLSKQL